MYGLSRDAIEVPFPNWPDPLVRRSVSHPRPGHGQFARPHDRAARKVSAMILRHITIDAGNPYELAQFWSTVTGWPLADGDAAGDDEVLVVAPAPVPGMLFIAVPESKAVKNRVHI